jgi:dipeptidyl aminopeptidase/acylaminoacyl peptidase
MNRKLYFSVAACSFMIARPATAQKVIPDAAFGARESVQGASLSPEGKRMAFIAPYKDRGNALYTVPVDGTEAPKRALVATGDPERLLGCGWVSEARLVCNVYSVQQGVGEALGMSRLVATNIDGSDVKLVSRRDNANALYFSYYGGGVVDWLPGQDGAILIARRYVPEEKIGSLMTKRDEGLGVERIDTASLQSKRIVSAKIDAESYIADGLGNVRIMGVADKRSQGYTTGVTKFLYRAKDKDDWLPLASFDSLSRQGFLPVAVDPGEDAVYGYAKKEGRYALYKRALDGSQREAMIFAHDEVDVSGLLTLGRSDRVIGLSYVTDRRTALYFDEPLAKLRTSLSKVLPNAPIISFEGASDDEQKLLIWAGSDVDPGRYYLYDRQSKQLRLLLSSRPELADYKLAPVKSVSVKAGDGTMIPGYLTLPPGSSGKGLPTIVMPHGGPGARDEWGFDWLAQYFANRGYAVLQPNFRGSTGYGDAWFVNNGFQSWKIAIGDVADSGRWLISEGIADPSKIAIFGWSYVGYAALQSGVVAPDLFKAIVAVAPVTDLNDLKEQHRGYSNSSEVNRFIGSGPHIREGSPAQRAASIAAPVLMFHGDLDLNVRVQASKLMADKLRDAGKPHELVLYPKLDHYLEDSSTRADMLKKSDDFLRKSMGM